MLRRSSLRRIIVATTALVILGILYLFPTADKKEANIPKTIEYTNHEKSVIYLLDYEHDVARTYLMLKETEPLAKIKEILESLTINGSKKEYIPNGFHPVIPENTKVNDVSLQEGILKIDFSKEFFNMREEDEDALLEALIYSLTEQKEVKGIIVFVEGKLLTEMPHSKTKLPPVLDRSFGVNKVYDIDHIEGTTKTTIYYLKKNANTTYFVPVTKIENTDKEHIEVIIENLKSSPVYETNLMSYLQANAELLSYTLLEDSISLSFNQFIFDDLSHKKIAEEVKYSIALSVKDSYPVNHIIFEVDDETVDTWKD